MDTSKINMENIKGKTVKQLCAKYSKLQLIRMYEDLGGGVVVHAGKKEGLATLILNLIK